MRAKTHGISRMRELMSLVEEARFTRVRLNRALSTANQTQGETRQTPCVRAVSIADEAKPGSRKGVAAEHMAYGKIQMWVL